MKKFVSLFAVLFVVLFAGLATAGDVRGPRVAVNRVAANGTDVYTFFFERGETATVRVIGDGDTDLDCYLLDGNGNTVDSDRGPSDTCYLTVIPVWTGAFTVRVRNLGDVYNEYTLRTN